MAEPVPSLARPLAIGQLRAPAAVRCNAVTDPDVLRAAYVRIRAIAGRA
jgi:hypothetical protein